MKARILLALAILFVLGAAISSARQDRTTDRQGASTVACGKHDKDRDRDRDRDREGTSSGYTVACGKRDKDRDRDRDKDCEGTCVS